MNRLLTLCSFWVAVTFQPAIAGRIPSSLEFDQIAQGVYVYTGKIDDVFSSPYGLVSNSTFVVGEKSVAVIDTGTSLRQGKLIRKAIRMVTDLPISHVISTHVHLDHIFGNRAFLDDHPDFVAHHKILSDLRAKAPYYQDRLADQPQSTGMKGRGPYNQRC